MERDALCICPEIGEREMPDTYICTATNPTYYIWPKTTGYIILDGAALIGCDAIK